jgi:hypothetical protein
MRSAEQQILQQSLRHLGGLAHQARVSLRAADRFVTEGQPADRDAASWLVCTALELAGELADEMDGLAKGMRESGVDAARQEALGAWRRTAHQLHAATRATDLYLEEDTADALDTGSWLLASALSLATRLADALDDGAGRLMAPEPARRAANAVDIRSVGA